MSILFEKENFQAFNFNNESSSLESHMLIFTVALQPSFKTWQNGQEIGAFIDKKRNYNCILTCNVTEKQSP